MKGTTSKADAMAFPTIVRSVQALPELVKALCEQIAM